MLSRLARVARWCAPSWTAACVGALAAGVVEGVAMPNAFGMAAGAGFVVGVVLPLLFVLGVIVRAAGRGWAPTMRGLTDETGRAPRLAGWLAFASISLVVLAVVTNVVTHALARGTTFRPMLVSYVVPAAGVLTAAVLIAVSRPAAHGASTLLGRLDTWFVGKREGRRSWLVPRRQALVISIVTLVGGAIGWLWVSPKLGPLDTSPARGPLVAIVVAIGVHVIAARQIEMGRWLRRGAGAACAVVVGCAVAAWQWRPDVTLEVWGELPIAGLVIDGAFDLSAIRDQMSLEPFKPVARPEAEHPDIVLIVIDTVRADRTPAYGGTAPMPFLKTLASRGKVFEWAFAPSNVTRRSIPSMFTGLSPDRVRGRVVGWALRVDPRLVLVAERFSAAGYETAGFMCCGGFYETSARTGLSRGLQHLEIEKNGTKLAERARKWIEERETRTRGAPRRPLLVVMHILDPHNWAGGNESPADESVRENMYARALTTADKMISTVVGSFQQREPVAQPFVIVTADHGEALGEHGQPFHSTDLYNSQLRVPLIVVGPGIEPGRVEETVSLTGLAPTLIELAGYAPFDADAPSIAPLIKGTREPRVDGVAFAAMIRDRSNPGGQTALVRGKWKLLIIEGRRELYDVHADPHETKNLIDREPAVAAELEVLIANRTGQK